MNDVPGLPLTTGEGNAAWSIYVHEDDPSYLSINNGGHDTLLRTSGGAKDNEQAAKFAAEYARLRERVSELPSPEAFAYLEQLRERHITQISALEKKCARLREQLDAAREALKAELAWDLGGDGAKRLAKAEERVSALTGALDRIFENTECSIGNRVLSKHDKFCAYHTASEALLAARAALEAVGRGTQ